MIIFRNLGDLLPPGRTPNIHWQVEYYPDDPQDDTAYPWGLAWVGLYPERFTGPTLLYVLVVDDYRRQGIAMRLIRACRERWPGLFLTEGVTEAGEALLAKLDEYETPKRRRSKRGAK